MRCLIIKMSSMGDVIHTLPALTDAMAHYPDITFDWVVEPGFADLPKMHPTVDNVIPLSIRTWRKKPFNKENIRQLISSISVLRQQKYDVIIDAQGLLKSAMVTQCARGQKCGLAKDSAREPLASIFYHQKHHVSWHQHAVYRIRELFAKSLGYTVPSSLPDYHLQIADEQPPLQDHTPYCVFLHATTWDTKHWPNAYWSSLLEIAARAGYKVLLPWGNEKEKNQAQKIVEDADSDAGQVLDKRLRLTELASLLYHAQGVIAVDTGLGHLSAALAKPTVSLYGPTDPARTGAVGQGQVLLSSDLGCAPCLSKHCRLNTQEGIYPPCFEHLSPQKVWQALLENMDCVSTSQKSA